MLLVCFAMAGRATKAIMAAGRILSRPLYLAQTYQEYFESKKQNVYGSINRTLKAERQLGRVHNTAKEDFAPQRTCGV